MKRCTLAVAILALMVGAGRTEVIIDTDTVIDQTINDVVRIVDGATPPTTVEIVDPADVSAVEAHHTCVVNMTGGIIRGNLQAYDASVLNVSGGSFGLSVVARDSSTAYLTGGNSEVVSALDSSTMNISGGDFEFVWASGESMLTVSAGKFSSLNCEHTSTAIISGGTFDSVAARGPSILMISGGMIDEISAGIHPVPSTCVVTVRGDGFNYPSGEIPETSGTLTGMLASGEPINAGFEILDGASIVLVPEPSSLAMLSAAVVVLLTCAWRKRRFV